MNRLCVYAIFRDEAHHVAEWAETTLDADHRVVLDTGSGDGTVDQLELHGIEVHHAALDPFRFDDARNMALAIVPPEYDWCLRLDADERLSPLWRASWEAMLHPGVTHYRYRVVNHGQTWGMHTRSDLHARFGFRWKYPTHEILEGNGPCLDVGPDMFVKHVPRGRRAHHDTNLDVLRAAVVEYPGDHRMSFYFGRELWYRGQWSEARRQLMQFIQLPFGWPPERCEAWRIIAAIDDHPERWLWKAIGECPERREPWVDLARLYRGQHRMHEARAMVMLAAERNDDTIYTTQSDCWGEDFEQLVLSLHG